MTNQRYAKKVMQRFLHPKNMGEIKEQDLYLADIHG